MVSRGSVRVVERPGPHQTGAPRRRGRYGTEVGVRHDQHEGDVSVDERSSAGAGIDEGDLYQLSRIMKVSAAFMAWTVFCRQHHASMPEDRSPNVPVVTVAEGKHRRCSGRGYGSEERARARISGATYFGGGARTGETEGSGLLEQGLRGSFMERFCYRPDCRPRVGLNVGAQEPF